MKNFYDDKKCHDITIMADYCADGLWRNGAAIDTDILKEEFNIPDNIADHLEKKIAKWQEMYEQFDFWSEKANSEETYKTDEFREFERLGTEIAKEVRKILPEDIPVIYFDEITGKRYIVQSNGEFIYKKDICD